MDGYNAADSGVKTVRQIVQRSIDLDIAELQPFLESYNTHCALARDAGQWKQAALYDRAKRHMEGVIKALGKIPAYYD